MARLINVARTCLHCRFLVRQEGCFRRKYNQTITCVPDIKTLKVKAGQVHEYGTCAVFKSTRTVYVVVDPNTSYSEYPQGVS